MTTLIRMKPREREEDYEDVERDATIETMMTLQMVVMARITPIVRIIFLAGNNKHHDKACYYLAFKVCAGH